MRRDDGVRIWRIAPSNQGQSWQDCRASGCIGIGWKDLGDFRKYESEKELDASLKRRGGVGQNGAQKIMQFVNEIRVGDIVVANKGESSILGIGIISGEYVPADAAENPMPKSRIPQVRAVQWFTADAVPLEKKFFGTRPRLLEELKWAMWSKIVDVYNGIGVDIQQLAAFHRSTLINALVAVPVLELLFSASEGTLTVAMRKHYKRDAELRSKKIESFISASKRLCCEVPGCGFDFELRYWELGRGYAQVHHLNQLASTGETTTLLEDLRIVCANCHVMIHRHNDCRPMSDLIAKKEKERRKPDVSL